MSSHTVLYLGGALAVIVVLLVNVIPLAIMLFPPYKLGALGIALGLIALCGPLLAIGWLREVHAVAALFAMLLWAPCVYLIHYRRLRR
jgi:hypothetical protein